MLGVWIRHVSITILRSINWILRIFHSQSQIQRVLQGLVLHPSRRIVRGRSLILVGQNSGAHGIHFVVLGLRLLRLIPLAPAEHEDQANEEDEDDAGHYYCDESRGR